MRHKNVETSREARLWISQVIIPVSGIIAVLLNEEAKYKISKNVKKVKESIKRKFKKQGS